MALFKFYLFGQPRVERDGIPVEISLHKALAILVYLAVTRRAHGRDALATLLWPESDQSTARANLRRALYTLNKSIGEGIIDVEQDTVALDPRAELWIDVDEFNRRIRECALAGVSQGSACLDPLAEAAALYKDDFLAGFTLPDSPAFDEWQFFEAERLRGSLARILPQLARAYRSRGEWENAIEYARRWLALDPSHEPAHRLLMELYASADQQAAALRQYQLCVKVLKDELGVSPQAETTELYESIRSGTRAAAAVRTFSPPTTRYTQGNVHIAYQVVGSGPVDIVFVPGFVSDLEQIWEDPDLSRFYERLSEFSRLILFDKRGMGLSDRVGHAPTLENTMDDICAVMDAVGSSRAVLFGVSEGGTGCALFAATYPERVAALVLYGTLAKGTKSADYPWALPQPLYDRWLEALTINWGQALNLEVFAPSRAQDERFQRWWAKSLRIASSPGEVRGVLEVLKGIDIRVALPAIRARTLVIHRTGDRAIRVGNGRFIASQIPNARLVELPGEDHWWWIGDADSIVKAVEQFVSEVQEPVAYDRVLATILAIEYTEEERSENAKASNLERFRASLESSIARGRGREVSRHRNGCVVLFDGPSRAIQCAQAVRRAAVEIGISMRAGLHTGEVAAGETDGAAFAVVASIVEQAARGQVFVSSIVKDLVVGSEYQFRDKGEFAGGGRLFALVD